MRQVPLRPARAGPPRRRALTWLLRGLAAAGLVLLAGIGGLAALLWGTLSAGEGRLRLPGLAAPVEITFDAEGVPRIRAASEHDAFMALGWLHARDRMFQMETMRRGAEGRLAEWGGPGLLRNDRFVRTLGLARHAAADYAALPEDTRAALQAYAAGVNAWIAARGRFAAPEFLALGAPEPWRPEQSLLWAKIMGLWLSGNWRTELDRARLAGILPPEHLAELWPPDPSPGRPDEPLAWREAALDAGQLARLAAALPRFPEPGTLPPSASNIWAVSGARTASGKPLLASDPHLGFQAPILWYLVRIELPGGRFLAGATSPGVPFIVIGRNERLAWGFTTTGSDTQDVFVERLAPGGYATPDGPVPFTEREERIAVRGAEPVTLRVRETRHGPVVSDLDAAPPADGQVLAVAMANLAVPDSAASGLLALNRAQSVAEAKAAARLITSPPQNLVVADASGGIALFLTGRVPVRRTGDGSLPAPGWDGSHDWTGWVPFEALPHLENPESGAVVNANNRIAPPGWPAFLGRDWLGDWRFRRIGELLAARPIHTAADFAAMQMDVRDLFAVEVLGLPPEGSPQALLARLPRPAGAAGEALDLLRAWDGRAAADLPQPLILNAWMEQLGRLALSGRGVPAGAWHVTPEFLRFLLALDGRGAWWCRGDCAALATRALEEAVAGLQASYGPDPAAWRWGAAHVARFEHPLLRFVPGLGELLGLRVPTDGDDQTVNRGGYGGAGAAPFAHVHGAGLRLVADLADAEGTRAVIATGQSGNPLSAHWGDLLRRWRDGTMLVLSRDAAGPGRRVQLVP